MKKYTVKCKGIVPIVFNTRQEEIDAELKTLKRDQLSEWERNNWKKKAMRDGKGNVIIPVIWFKAAFTNACKHSKIVPSYATSKRETYTRYAEAMYFQSSSFKCSDKELKMRSAYMGAQGAGSTTKVLKCYPTLANWETVIDVVDPSGRMTMQEFKTLFDYAGMFEGVGDFRKVNCGRFEIVEIKELK